MIERPRIEDLRRRVRNDPRSITFAQLAEEYRRIGLLEDSVDICRAGLSVHPGYVSARVTLGRSLVELGHLDSAQVELQAALERAPGNLSAIRGLAEVSRRRGALADPAGNGKEATSPPGEQPGSTASRAANVGRAMRTIAALELWLGAVHGTRADRRP
jgi:tetratricopeptide (TPR) repeat protein